MDRLEELRAKLAEGGLTAEEQSELSELEAAAKADDDADGADEDGGEEEVEIDEKTVGAIAKKTAAGLQETVEKLVEEGVTKGIQKIEKALKPKLKIAGGEQIDKGSFAVKFLKAIQTNSQALMDELRTEKEMSVGTNSAGGYLVPPAEFFADILKLDSHYGVAMQELTPIYVKGNAATFNVKTTGVSFYATAEKGVKRLTQFGLDRVNLSLRKFAAIAPWTDELDEDSALNMYNEIVKEFAHARDYLVDQIVFLDSTSGILPNLTTNVITGFDTPGELTRDILSQLKWAVPVDARRGAKFFLHPSWIGVIERIKDSQGRPIMDIERGTILGHPFVETEILPAIDDPATGERNILFGNIREYYKLIMKSEMQLKLLTEASIGGAGGDATIDLASQDERAVRAVVRLDGRMTFERAFSVMKMGTVS